jgi:hypothetical protein
MPAINMKASAQSVSDVLLTSAGKAALCCPLSGPTGSPLDFDQSGNFSTGALTTGIGFGLNRVISDLTGGNFTDDYTPGVTLPSGSAATSSTLLAIGGGHCDPTECGECVPSPYDEQPLLGFGNGILRDAGAAPAYTGHSAKLVTATGTVVNGDAVEAGFTNQSGVTITVGQSVFGSTTAASPAVTPDYQTPDVIGDLTPTIAEPSTAVETYTSSETDVTWDLNGGADVASFEIDAATGALAFQAASSAGSYAVIIRCTSADGARSNSQLVAVTVTL